jgi:FixJ family two-component response regulator
VIAYDLGISTRTAEHHRSAVMKKMAANSWSHLVRMVLDVQHRRG